MRSRPILPARLLARGGRSARRVARRRRFGPDHRHDAGKCTASPSRRFTFVIAVARLLDMRAACWEYAVYCRRISAQKEWVRHAVFGLLGISRMVGWDTGMLPQPCGAGVRSWWKRS